MVDLGCERLSPLGRSPYARSYFVAPTAWGGGGSKVASKVVELII